MSYHYYQSKPGFNPQMQNTPKKNNDQDPKSGDKEKRRRQKTTAIALSILLVVTTMVVGYGMISNEKEVDETITNKIPSTSMISSEEHNTQQAEKIRQLKKQMFETNQKLHEYKTILFAKGDPREKAQLALLSNELIEKSRSTNDFAARIEELEGERVRTNETIKKLEDSIAALSESSVAQKNTNEQTIQDYQNQFKDLEAQLSREKESLGAAIAELETLKERSNGLINELEAHYDTEIIFKQKIEEINGKLEYEGEINRSLNQTVAALESDIGLKETRIQELMSSRESEMQELMHTNEAQQHQLAAQLQEITTAKEELARQQDEISKQQEELQKALQSFIAANETIAVLQMDIGEKETRIQELIGSTGSEMQELLNTKEAQQQELAAKLQELTTAKEELASREDKISRMQDELQKAAHSFTAANEIIAALQFNIAEKETRIEELNGSLASDIQELLNTKEAQERQLAAQLQEMMTAKEEHARQQDEIFRTQDEVQKALESFAAANETIAVLRKDLGEKEVQIQELISTRNLEIEELTKTMEAQQQELAEQLQEITTIKEELARRHDEISKQHDELQKALQSFASANETIAALRSDIGEKQVQIQELISARNLEIEDLTKTKEAQQQELVGQLREMTVAKEELSLQYDEISIQKEELEKLLESFVAANQAFNTEHEIMQATLKKEVENSSLLKKEHEELQANYLQARQLTQSLEEKLQQTSQKLSTLEEDRNKAQAEHDAIQKELESIIAFQESKINEHLETINSLGMKDGEIEQLANAKEELARKNEEFEKLLMSFEAANEAFKIEQEKMQTIAQREIENSSKLKTDHEEVLANYLQAQNTAQTLKEELQNSSRKVTLLEEDQTTLQAKYDEIRKELESAISFQDLKSNEYLATVHTLKNTVKNLESERWKIEEAENLRNELQASLQAAEQAQQEITALRTQLEDNVAAQADFEGLLREQKAEVSTMMQQLQLATENLDKEKIYNYELSLALNNSIAMYENVSSELTENSRESIVLLQQQLSDLQKEVAQKNERLAQLTKELESTSNIEKDNTKKLKEEIQKNIAEISSMLKVVSIKEEEIISLKNITNEQKRTINELTKTIGNQNSQ